MGSNFKWDNPVEKEYRSQNVPAYVDTLPDYYSFQKLL